ncbi:MAG: hypothetical protein ACRC1W_09255 [Shewanella sp.]
MTESCDDFSAIAGEKMNHSSEPFDAWLSILMLIRFNRRSVVIVSMISSPLDLGGQRLAEHHLSAGGYARFGSLVLRD